jgi:hypothetical protein
LDDDDEDRRANDDPILDIAADRCSRWEPKEATLVCVVANAIAMTYTEASPILPLVATGSINIRCIQKKTKEATWVRIFQCYKIGSCHLLDDWLLLLTLWNIPFLASSYPQRETLDEITCYQVGRDLFRN